MIIKLENCISSLKEASSLLLLCHSHPDGDTLGSATALAHALGILEKKVAVLCDDKIASCYDFMFKGVHQFLDFEPDLIVAVDVADPVLLGKANETKYSDKVDLCIDHHGSNKLYANATWLEPDSASCAEMMFRLIKDLDVPITKQMASCLFTGISTDTGCFRFSNTTPDTHRAAAELIELGADSRSIIEVFFETKSKAYAALEKLALDGMQMYLNGQCAIMPVTRAMFGKSGASDSDTDRLANLPRQIEGVLVGVTLKEQPDGLFKASLRTHGDVDASAIAARLGGGGHKGAAGCTLGSSIAQATQSLVEEIAKEIGEYSNI